MWNERLNALLGEEKLKILKNSHIALFGVGGVGSYAFEALVRSGIGFIDVTDGDVYCESNINRQLYATNETIGLPKVEVAKSRAFSINPECAVNSRNYRFDSESLPEFDFESYDYVIDAIDSVDCKTLLISTCYEKKVKIISSMGAGNRTHPEMLKITDIFKTENDPLAKVMRGRLRKCGVKKLKTVCSDELPSKYSTENVIGSFCPVTAAAGMTLAAEVINDLLK